MKAANRVALNTGILYGRMLITMGITLYSTRLVLNALGSTDYGIFNLLAGIILMLSFLNTAMATSTQRYLSYHQGKEDFGMQQRVFSNSFTLHIIIGLVIVCGLEISGLFLFNGFLNIPVERVDTARIIYHFMSLTVFFTIIAVPFNGSLIAHENMFWVAFVNIIESLLRLAIASALYFVSGDKLIIYGLMTASITIVSFILYASYCFRKYQDCSLRDVFRPDKKLIKELGSFAGWNLFGSICYLARTQGSAVILNLFFGTTVNAAYGISNQVGSQMLFFSSTMLRSLNPQIMKSEGAGDRGRMLKLATMASKFGFCLLAFIAIPCIFEMPGILSFWLKNVPENTVMFCKFLLIGTLISQCTIGLQSAAQAVGDIGIYQMVVGGLTLMNLPMSYFLLANGYPAFSVMIVFCSIEVLTCLIRIKFLNKMAGLSVSNYLRDLFGRLILPILISVITCLGLVSCIEMRYRFILTIAASSALFFLSLYFFGMNKRERNILKNIIGKVVDKVKKRN